jgi:hypothetical protein
LTIPDFSISELDAVKNRFPGLIDLINNPKLESIIKKPFYLNIAIRVLNGFKGGSLDLPTFKKHLLEQGIQKKGDSLAGVSAKRLTVFSQIVFDRAKSKMQFASVKGEGKEEIVAGLLADNLLVEGTAHGQYAPAHDIFEDIVIDHYFDELYLTHNNDVVSFIQAVEPFPVLRRGIRWWAIGKFINQDDKFIQFISGLLLATEINKYSKDEIFLAILYSPNCTVLLEQLKELLNLNDYAVLKRIILLLHINFTVKNEPDENNQTIKTNGPGWLAVLNFIERHNLYDDFLLAVFRLIDKASLSYPIDADLPPEAHIIAIAAMRHISDMKAGTNDFDVLKGLYKVLFRTTNLVKDEVKSLTGQALTAANRDSKDKFYVKMAKMMVNDTTGCIQLYRIFPEEIIAIFKALWLDSEPRKYTDSFSHSHPSAYKEWGLIDLRDSYLGPSAYRYPVRYLLKFHAEVAIEFIIGFINHVTENYAGSASGVDRVVKITFEMQNGEQVTQMYNSTLWSLYRGIENVPEVVQSIHMALEDFLLKSIEHGVNIKPYVNRLVTGSKSVSITSVVCSVVMRYPFAIGKEVLSFLRVKEFYELDFNRKNKDLLHSRIGETPSEPYFAKERAASNGLSFRNVDFEQLVLGLQIYGVQELDGIIDDLKKDKDTKNTSWQFRFHRMDKRERDIIETKSSLLLNPKPLPKRLQKLAKQTIGEVNETLLSGAYMWGYNIFKDDKTSDLEEWRKHYANSLLKSSSALTHMMRPQLLIAAIGIRDHLLALNKQELEFAAGELLGSLRAICAGFRVGHFDVLDLSERPVLQVTPFLLFSQFEEFQNKEITKRQLTELLLFLGSHYINDFVSGILKHGWLCDSIFAGRLSSTSINLYTKQDTHQVISRLLRSEDPITEDKFSIMVTGLDESEPLVEPSIDPADRGNYERLIQGLQMIPFAHVTENHFGVIQKMYLHFLSITERGYTKDTQKNNFGIYIGDFLSSDSVYAKPLLDFVLEKLPDNFDYGFKAINNMTLSGHDKKFPLEFWQRITKLAQYFFSTSSYNGIAFALFFGEMPDPLEIRHKVQAEGIVKDMYQALIKSGYFDDANIGPKVFRFLSGIGTAFQPECIEWLLEGSEKFQNGMSYLKHEDLERFVNQLYTSHLPCILSKPEIKDYYLKFLEFLIDRESDVAFRIREEIF